jgi:hypothetical protein
MSVYLYTCYCAILMAFICLCSDMEKEYNDSKTESKVTFLRAPERIYS